MSADITPVVIKKEGVSDDLYLITDIHYADGDSIEEGDIILTIETSKAVTDIEAEHAGYVFYLHEEQDEVSAGVPVAVISQSPDFDKESYQSGMTAKADIPKEDNAKPAGELRISHNAKQVLAGHNIDPKMIGKAFITQQDVLNYLNPEKKTSRTSVSSNLVILGGGGHGRMCIDIIERNNFLGIKGILDPNIPVGTMIKGYPVLGDSDILLDLYQSGVTNAVIGIGAVTNPLLREKLFRMLKDIGFSLPNLIHPDASVEKTVRMGEGNQILQSAIVGSDVLITDNCIINSGAVVSHESVLESNAHITPGAVLGGDVGIGENTIIGMGSTVYLGKKVGKNVIIYNGVNIFDNVPDNAVVK